VPTIPGLESPATIAPHIEWHTRERPGKAQEKGCNACEALICRWRKWLVNRGKGSERLKSRISPPQAGGVFRGLLLLVHYTEHVCMYAHTLHGMVVLFTGSVCTYRKSTVARGPAHLSSPFPGSHAVVPSTHIRIGNEGVQYLACKEVKVVSTRCKHPRYLLYCTLSAPLLPWKQVVMRHGQQSPRRPDAEIRTTASVLTRGPR
jgi:hypothetical protein